jgi:hypothetical protein
MVFDGYLAVEILGRVLIIGPGETININPGRVHCWQKSTDVTACVLVFTRPPFNSADYHLATNQEPFSLPEPLDI